MTQEAVERVLGRLITDERFRRLATESLEVACLQEGFRLYPAELRLLSCLELQHVAKLADQLSPGLCRAGGSACTLDQALSATSAGTVRSRENGNPS